MPPCVCHGCCFCFDLHTGCLLIGYLKFVAEAAGAIVALLKLITHVLSPEATLNKEVIAVIILILLLFMSMAFTVTLLIGVHKDKRGHVKAYLIYTVIDMVLFVILYFTMFTKSHNVGAIIGALMGLALNIYFLMIVRSYYCHMNLNKPAVANSHGPSKNERSNA